jgi:hypothetical protein
MAYLPPQLKFYFHSEHCSIARNEACTREMRNAYRISVGKPKGKRLFGTATGLLKYKENVKIGLNNRLGGCRVW